MVNNSCYLSQDQYAMCHLMYRICMTHEHAKETAIPTAEKKRVTGEKVK